MYEIQFTKQAIKDGEQVKRAGLKSKADEIFRTLQKNPYEESQGFEYLKYDLSGSCSRRINRQNRVVYEVFPNTEYLKLNFRMCGILWMVRYSKRVDTKNAIICSVRQVLSFVFLRKPNERTKPPVRR